MPQSKQLGIGRVGGVMTEILSGFIGVLVGSAMTWFMTYWFEKRRAAVALYSDFVAPEMERIRNKAGDALRANAEAPEPLSFKEMHDVEGYENFSDVVVFINFWEKTEIQIKAGYADREFVKTALKHYLEHSLKDYLDSFCSLCEQNDSESFRVWTERVRSLARRWDI